VLIQNFRPGVAERVGIDYETVNQINPGLVYGAITGYGDRGPWRDYPGQDLLAQARSGLLWLTGDANDPPTPMGLAVADMFAGAALVQGILAALVRRGTTGEGANVEISLMEALLDLQLEVLTTFLNDGGQIPQRSSFNNAHAYLGAPYGVYETSDSYIALAMNPLQKLGELLELPQLGHYTASDAFEKRDEIKKLIAERLRTAPTRHWLDILQPADVWCSEIMDWPTLVNHEAFQALEMTQTVQRRPGVQLETTRCPLRINGERMSSSLGAPSVGQHSEHIIQAFGLDQQSRV
jgi:crotonobetainyl-CoA:carnitine CoA-transferase CaiB-like acyl-CoA transferase